MPLEGSPWQDLSREHERIRRSLENLIIQYTIEKRKKLRTPVIVAPYGSGKTTLLKHLELFSWSKRIPALRVNLSEIVRFIKERIKEKISEDELPKFLEEFFNYKIKSVTIPYVSEEEKEDILNDHVCGRIRGVLLIDEIEEAYSDLKEIVSATTTVFRQVFENVHDGNLKIFPILAFGPSSIFMEIASLAGGWRTITSGIPLVEPRYVESLLRSKVHIGSRFLVKALSNAVWWAGKGRCGWVSKLIDAHIPESIINTLSRIEKDREYLDSIDYLVEEDLMDNLRQEIIENVPLLDERKYRGYLRELKNEEVNLFKLLVFLVAPTPETFLAKYININEIKGIRLSEKIFIRSSIAIDKGELVRKIIEVSEHIIKKPEELTSLERIINMVLSSWSDETDSLILVPITSIGRPNVEPVAKLLDLAINIALETYKPEVVNVIEKLSIKDIVENLPRYAFIDLQKTHYILNPQTLFDIYPPTMINPLVACSKGSRSLDINLGKRYYEVTEQLKEFMCKNYGVRSGLYFLITREIKDNRVLFSELKKRILGILVNLNKPPILIPLAATGGDLENLRDFLLRKLRIYDKLKLIIIPREMGPKLSLFLLGLLYSFHNCQSELMKIKEQPIEGYIVRQYSRGLDRLIMEIHGKWYGESLNTMRKISSELNKLKEITETLSKAKGRILGSKQTIYFWTVPLCHEKVKELLKEVIEILADLRESFLDLLNNIYSLGMGEEYKAENVLDKLYKDISLLAQKDKALSYLEKSTKLVEEVSKLVNTSDYFESLIGIYKEILEYTTPSMETSGKTLYDILKNNIQRSSKVISNINNLAIDEPLAYVFSSIALRDKLSDKFEQGDLLIRLRLKISNNIGTLNNLESSIKELLNTAIGETKIGDIDIDKVKRLKTITKYIVESNTKLRSLLHIIDEANKYIVSTELTTFDKLMVLELIFENIIKVFARNLSEVKIFNKLKDTIDKVKTEIDIISNEIEKLEKEYGDIINILNIKEHNISEVIIEDVKLTIDGENITAWEKKLKEIRGELKKLTDTLSKHKDIITKMRRLREEIRKLNTEVLSSYD